MDGDIPFADVAREGGHDGLLDVPPRSCSREELADEVDVRLLGLGEAASLNERLVGVVVEFQAGRGFPLRGRLLLAGLASSPASGP